MSAKTLITIKSKLYCPKLNISGLLLIVIDKESSRIIGANGVFVSGEHLKNARTNIPTIDFIEAINVASQQYAVQKEYVDVIKNYLLQRIDQKIIQSLLNNVENNTIAAVNEVQRIVKSALNIDIIDVYSEFDSISNAEYNEIIIAQKIDSLTLAQQSEIAAQYYNNDKQLAEESIKKSKQDIGIIVLYLTSSQFSGICFCFVNCTTRKMLYCFCWLDDSSIVQSEVKSGDALYDLFNRIVKAAERTNRFTPVQHEIQSNLWKIDIDALIHAVEHEASGIASQLFASLLQKLKDIQVRAELHRIDVIRFHMLYNPSQFDKKEIEEGDSTFDKKLVAVDLVLSPTSGKKVSQLQKGDFIYVLIDTSTPYGYDVAKTLNLINNNKNTPIEAEVYSVNYNKKKGYTLFVKITESLYGKATEEQDIKVKMKLSTNVDEEETSSKVSLIIGLIAGLIVIAILLFILLT